MRISVVNFESQKNVIQNISVMKKSRQTISMLSWKKQRKI